MIMKRLAVITAVFILGASLASAQTRQSSPFSNPLLNEVVRMSNAGIGNATIIAYAKARQARLEGGLTADDLIALREAGVGEPVVQFLASVTGFGVGDGVSYEAGEGETVAVNPDGGYAYPYGYGYGYPYWGWGWDGWWGYPYFSGSVFVGGGHGHGGHGGHGGGGHGGHGGGGHGGGGHGGGGHGGGHGGGGHGGRR